MPRPFGSTAVPAAVRPMILPSTVVLLPVPTLIPRTVLPLTTLPSPTPAPPICVLFPPTRMPVFVFGIANSPVLSVPMRLPNMCVSSASSPTLMPSVFPEITLRSASAGPPIVFPTSVFVLNIPPTETPELLLPSPASPPVVVPRKFPSTLLPLDWMRMPLPESLMPGWKSLITNPRTVLPPVASGSPNASPKISPLPLFSKEPLNTTRSVAFVPMDVVFCEVPGAVYPSMITDSVIAGNSVVG